MQNTDVEQTWLQRVLRVSTVMISLTNKEEFELVVEDPGRLVDVIEGRGD